MTTCSQLTNRDCATCGCQTYHNLSGCIHCKTPIALPVVRNIAKLDLSISAKNHVPESKREFMSAMRRPGAGRRTKLTPEEHLEILRRTEAGESRVSLARAFHMSAPGILYVIRRAREMRR